MAFLKKNLITLLAIAVTVCLVGLIVSLTVLITTIHAINREISQKEEKIDLLNQSLFALSSDYNFLRRSLGLETRDFPILREEAASGNGSQDSPLTQGLKIIQSRYYDEIQERRFQTKKTDPVFLNVIKETGLSEFEEGLFSIALVKDHNIRFSLSFSPATDEVTITAAGTGDAYTGKWDEQAADFIRTAQKKVDSYYQKVKEWRRQLVTAAADPRIAFVLNQRELALEFRGEDDVRFWSVITKEKEEILTLSFDKQEGAFYLNTKKIGAPSDLASELASLLPALDTRSSKERRLEAVLASLEESFKDQEFQSFLQDAGLKLASERRENEEFYFYDVFHNGIKIGAFAVFKDSAEIYFTDKDDVQITALTSVADVSGFKKKTVTAANESPRREELYSDTDMTAFLLLGQNEENSDTTILVQANAKTTSISLISIPRDLLYHGARINKFVQRGGYEHCVSEISNITGVPMKKYAAVDIHALISLIDLLGGVDVTLRHDLIDPTYKIKENGVWRTLAYPKGSYHLNGIQAMRIIRSRATTSDFNRAYRQQLVLAALFDKLKKRCGESLDVALSVFSSLLRYVKTNLSPLEIARYFVMFKDYRITTMHVLDTTNILKETYSALYLLPLEEQKKLLETTEDKTELGAYILLPRNNDWDLIRAYIRVLLSGGDTRSVSTNSEITIQAGKRTMEDGN